MQIKDNKIDVSDEMKLFKRRMTENGLKSTPQREELAIWIFQMHEHFTVDEIIASFREKGKRVSSATVYRVIQMMLELGMVIEHDFGKGYKHYEHTPGHPHHDHFICNECGKISEFSDMALEELKHKIAEENHFKMTSHSLQIFGYCKECQK